jgi:hypothetical protein
MCLRIQFCIHQKVLTFHFRKQRQNRCTLKCVGEGEYVIPTCTVFGLHQEEITQLKNKGLRQGTGRFVPTFFLFVSITEFIN